MNIHVYTYKYIHIYIYIYTYINPRILYTYTNHRHYTNVSGSAQDCQHPRRLARSGSALWEQKCQGHSAARGAGEGRGTERWPSEGSACCLL